MVQKQAIVRFTQEAEEEYLGLKEIVKREKEKRIAGSFHQTLLRSIDSKMALLKTNPGYGIAIQKKLIPEKYKQKYAATNLWKINLSGFWRMIYTLHQPPKEKAVIEIITIWLDILDIIDHKTYDKIFGYRKK